MFTEADRSQAIVILHWREYQEKIEQFSTDNGAQMEEHLNFEKHVASIWESILTATLSTRISVKSLQYLNQTQFPAYVLTVKDSQNREHHVTSC